MEVIFIVMLLGLLLASAAVIAFIWATRAGQFDDLETPAMRAVMDDDDDDVQPAG